MTTATEPTDLLVTAAIESEVRRVMAERCQLKRLPGTHGQQAEMLAEVDHLLDLLAETDHGQAAAPHA